MQILFLWSMRLPCFPNLLNDPFPASAQIESNNSIYTSCVGKMRGGDRVVKLPISATGTSSTFPADAVISKCPPGPRFDSGDNEYFL